MPTTSCKLAHIRLRRERVLGLDHFSDFNFKVGMRVLVARFMYGCNSGMRTPSGTSVCAPLDERYGIVIN